MKVKRNSLEREMYSSITNRHISCHFFIPSLKFKLIPFLIQYLISSYYLIRMIFNIFFVLLFQVHQKICWPRFIWARLNIFTNLSLNYCLIFVLLDIIFFFSRCNYFTSHPYYKPDFIIFFCKLCLMSFIFFWFEHYLFKPQKIKKFKKKMKQE